MIDEEKARLRLFEWTNNVENDNDNGVYDNGRDLFYDWSWYDDDVEDIAWDNADKFNVI